LLGTSTQIDTIDMLSPSLGFGVALPVNKHRDWYYLVKTTDLGDSWTVRGVMPMPSFVGEPGLFSEPEIHFVDATTGYASIQHGPVYVTNDGGMAWSKMSVPGIWPTFVVTGNVVSVVSDVCEGALPNFGPLECPSKLAQYRVGATTPMRIESIPALGRAGQWRGAAALSATSPESAVVVEGGTEGSDSSLLTTSNAGASWQLLSDPCEGLIVDQLLTSNPHRWLLYCWLDGGMNQGASDLWASTDEGGSWKPVARANEDGLNVGRIGDVANTIYPNGSDTMLYGAMGGAAGGLEFSRDGGAQWVSTSIRTNYYGGAAEYVSTFGLRGAIFGIQGGPQYRTMNGVSWSEIPSLPAGTYEGDPICTSRGGTSVRLSKTVTGIPSTTIDFPVVFTNHAITACYLNGTPVVQPVSGSQQRAVGWPAFPETDNGGGGFVVLKPHGGTASIVFARSATSADCLPRTMSGITIRFAPPSSFYVTIPQAKVCAQFPSVDSGGVVKGLVSWL
jgi:hypothetical protein